MVKRSLMLAAMAISTASAPPPGTAPVRPPVPMKSAPPTTFNCILASNAVAQKETDAKQRTLAELVLYFYLGRVNPNGGPQQLGADLKQAGNSLRGAALAPLINGCLREMQQKAQMLQSVGRQLQQGK